jgi:hypothetical protein
VTRQHLATMPFYIRELRIHGFWYPQNVLKPIPSSCRKITRERFSISDWLLLSNLLDLLILFLWRTNPVPSSIQHGHLPQVPHPCQAQATILNPRSHHRNC